MSRKISKKAQAEGQIEEQVVDLENGSETPKAQGQQDEKQEVASSNSETHQEQTVEEKKTKPKVNCRPYLELTVRLLEAGTTRKELIEAVRKEFPQVGKGAIETFASDLGNPKYSYFQKTRPVIKQPDGRLIFADSIQAVEETPAEAVATAEESSQPEQTTD